MIWSSSTLNHLADWSSKGLTQASLQTRTRRPWRTRPRGVSPGPQIFPQARQEFIGYVGSCAATSAASPGEAASFFATAGAPPDWLGPGGGPWGLSLGASR